MGRLEDGVRRMEDEVEALQAQTPGGGGSTGIIIKNLGHTWLVF